MTGIETLPAARHRRPSAVRTAAEIMKRWGWPGYVLVGFALLAIVAPAVAPHPAAAFNVGEVLAGPSAAHPFGTDQFGRDLFSRVLLGSRSLATVAGLSTAVALIVGVTWGLAAALLGGIRDEVLMRSGDVLLSIPELLSAMVIVAMFGSSTATLVLAVVVAVAPSASRVVRSAALNVVNAEFVAAARLAGESRRHLMFREVLPVILPVVAVEAAVRFGLVLLLIASLGFLGLGVQPPTPDWGLIVNESRPYMGQAPWLVIFPAGCIALVILACHTTADRLGERGVERVRRSPRRQRSEAMQERDDAA